MQLYKIKEVFEEMGFTIVNLRTWWQTEFVKTNFKETNWTTESEFVFVDKSTLICTVSGDGNAPLNYKKIR